MAEFTDIRNNVTNTTITGNTATASSHGYIGSIILTAATGYKFNSVNDITLQCNAFINNNSYITYDAILQENQKTISDDGQTITLNFRRLYFQPQYLYTPIKISGVVSPVSGVTITNNIANTSETHAINNNEITINIVGNISNYRFTDNPTITYTDNNGITQTAVCSVSVNNGISTATTTIIDANLTINTFTINGTYEQYIEIINNINGVTETHSFLNNDVTINLSGTLNGYQIGANTYVTYTDINDNTATAYFTRTDGNTKAHVYLTDCNTGYTITINGIYKLVVNVINNIDNVTDSYNYNNEQLIFNIVGNISNYRFTDNPTITYTDNNGITQTAVCSVSVVENTSTATATIINADLTATFTINGTYDKILSFIFDITNCIVTGVNEYAERNGIYNIIATANEYYKFNVIPFVRLYKTGTYIDVNFTISIDELTAVLTLDLSNYANDYDDLTQITIKADASINTQYLDKYGAINVYVVTNDNLTEFASKRFFNTQATTPQPIDLGNYIASLKRIFIDFTNIPLIPNILRCGNYNTEINVNTPLYDVITLNCGFVDIPKPNNNITDLKSEINIFLPFIGFVEINSEYVGERISVNYICNIITATAIVNLICNNITFAQYECKISTDLFYKTADTNKINNIDYNNNVLKGLTPFVNFKSYTDLNEKIINSDCKRGLLSTFSGYVECSEIENLTTVLPSEIRAMIEKELFNGVYL